MSQKVLIVGAGPGGLAAAMLLAAEGMDVEVFEINSTAGGRCGLIEHQGFRFDRGPTFFLYPEIIKQIFQQCGFHFQNYVELIKLDPLYNIVFENNDSIRATHDLDSFREQIAKFCLQDGENLDAFLDDNRLKFQRFGPVLKRPFNSIRDLVSWDMLRGLTNLRITKSVDQDLSQFFSNEKIRLAFSFQSKYLGMSPFNCPSLFTILSFMEHEYGVYHPVGGCNAVMEAMVTVAKEMGVRIRFNDPVLKVNFSGHRFESIQTRSENYKADAMVVNADFSHFMNRFVPQSLLSKWNRKKLNTKRYSCSTFMMYLGLRGTFPELEHHTIFLSEDYHCNLKEIEDGGTPPQRPSFYIQNACRTDLSLAPEGCSTLYILVPVANQSNPIDWANYRSKYRRLVLDRLRVLGLHDIEERILFEQICTPQMWQEDHSIHLGATFNLAHSLDQMLLWRPHNRFEELENVYLVGGGTHPGSGLPVIFEGARISTQMLCRDLRSKRSPESHASTLATENTSLR